MYGFHAIGGGSLVSSSSSSPFRMPTLSHGAVRETDVS